MKLNRSILDQLRCYFDVISRVHDYQNLALLSSEDIYDLLSWDLEKYRQQQQLNYGYNGKIT